ncbi:MAG: hypothetical protein IH605_21445 [Burkholderiales bacterium]|nr:hypothetical protein [Burkholderiales bacterium]
MANRPDPYVKKDPGDIMLASDWNEMQVQGREEVHAHRHTGEADGQPIPREGIAQKAIDGTRIDPASNVTVGTLTSDGNLTVKGELKVNGKAILDNVADLLATLAPRLADNYIQNGTAAQTANLNISGNGTFGGTMVAGKVGIGTNSPSATLQLVDKNQGPDGTLLVLGPTKQANLRLGYDAEYSWIQAHGAKPLALNPIGNNVGIGTTAPVGKIEVNGTAVISNGNSYATGNNYMAAGSLTIGSITANYGGGQKWNANTAGLLLETKDNTEIAVHDSKTRVASLMYYEGGAANRISIGRDMGWGAIGQLLVNGAISAGNSDLYFTKTDHKHTGFGNTAGYAAIENAADYDSLMILGRAGTDKARKVRLWDYLEVNGRLDVTGDLLGAAKNAANQAQRVRCGQTSDSAWVAYGKNGIYVEIDTSHAGFSSTPVYVASLGGNGGHWDTTGGSSIYSATKTGFKVYVRWADGRALSPEDAKKSGWHIIWMAVGS